MLPKEIFSDKKERDKAENYKNRKNINHLTVGKPRFLKRYRWKNQSINRQCLNEIQ